VFTSRPTSLLGGLIYRINKYRSSSAARVAAAGVAAEVKEGEGGAPAKTILTWLVV
jgi:hypothetical protein